MIFNLTSGGFSAHMSNISSDNLTSPADSITFPSINHIPDFICLMSMSTYSGTISSTAYIISALVSTYDPLDTMNISNVVLASGFKRGPGVTLSLNAQNQLVITSNGGKFYGDNLDPWSYTLFYTDAED